MSNRTESKIPTPAEIKAWPKFKAWVVNNCEPGATSRLVTSDDGVSLWVYGGMLYDTTDNHLSAYSMKDATNWERTSVSQTLEVYRDKWFGVDKKMTPKQIIADRGWVPVDGRPGVYVMAIARECPFGGPDAGMRPGAASEIGEAFGHFEQELDTDVEGPDGKRLESEFILTRVWSPEHGVQLAVRIEDGKADGPGHSVNNLRAFHQRLGEELERLLEDHPEQAGYWSGK